MGWLNNKITEITHKVTPLQKFARDATYNNHLTPDIAMLDQKWAHLLFVYDEMQTGLEKHNLIKDDATKEYDAYTVNPFELYKKHLGRESFAVARPADRCGDTSTNYGPARIRGELYLVRVDPTGNKPNPFIALDLYKQNTLEFERVRVKVAIPYRKVLSAPHYPKPITTGVFVEIKEAWMYVGTDYWNDHIDAGPRRMGRFFSAVNVYVPHPRNVPDHYHFTRKECFNK